MKQTLFLQAPSFDGFDGGAESRYQTKRAIRSFRSLHRNTSTPSFHVSLAPPYPGTTLYKQAVDNGWLAENEINDRVRKEGVQLAAIGYPHQSREDIRRQLKRFYMHFYFGRSKIGEIMREMLTNRDTMKRRLRAGVEFFRFLRAREA